VRERNIYEVAYPDPNDPIYKQQSGGFRAELHDRLVAPIYPIAFTVLSFAILGAPRTSRQSREISLIMSLVLIGGLRMVGFACNVFASQTVMAIYVLYGSLILAFAIGIFTIARGAVLEPPAFIMQPLVNLRELLTRRLQPS
jgi:lipopolysaccharide export system permease protein